MGKSKWVVNSKYTTRKELEEFYKKEGIYLDDADVEDFNEVEISILRDDNTHGKKSYGWEDENKIILFDDVGDVDQEYIDWCEEVAKTMCEALNRKGL